MRDLKERSRAGPAGLENPELGVGLQNLGRRHKQQGLRPNAHPTHAGKTGFTLCASDTCAGRERVFTPEAGQALTQIRPLTPIPHLNCGVQKWLYRCGPHFSQPRS